MKIHQSACKIRNNYIERRSHTRFNNWWSSRIEWTHSLSPECKLWWTRRLNYTCGRSPPPRSKITLKKIIIRGALEMNFLPKSSIGCNSVIIMTIQDWTLIIRTTCYWRRRRKEQWSTGRNAWSATFCRRLTNANEMKLKTDTITWRHSIPRSIANYTTLNDIIHW